MRVIAGEARGRKFIAPNVDSVRPTSDRVREAMFDVLSHLGGLSGARVLDLFAGSGAFGIESLSRGAAEVIFVDQDRNVAKTIKDNLAAVKLEQIGKFTIVVNDAIAFCRTRRERLSDRGQSNRSDLSVSMDNVDITFCDPPYSFTNWPKLLAVVPGDLLVLESSKPIALPTSLDTYRVYKYGSTLVTVAHRRGEGSESSQDELPDSSVGEASQ
jgi:16S rRNA (guanine966-N2)-methyltransferase